MLIIKDFLLSFDFLKLVRFIKLLSFFVFLIFEVTSLILLLQFCYWVFCFYWLENIHEIFMASYYFDHELLPVIVFL